MQFQFQLLEPSWDICQSNGAPWICACCFEEASLMSPQWSEGTWVWIWHSCWIHAPPFPQATLPKGMLSLHSPPILPPFCLPSCQKKPIHWPKLASAHAAYLQLSLAPQGQPSCLHRPCTISGGVNVLYGMLAQGTTTERVGWPGWWW